MSKSLSCLEFMLLGIYVGINTASKKEKGKKKFMHPKILINRGIFSPELPENA